MDTQLIEAGRTTIARGLNWLEQHRAQIVTQKDLSAHYKAPYLYAAVGDSLHGRFYANLMQGKYQQADGDFRTSATKRAGCIYRAARPIVTCIRTVG